MFSLLLNNTSNLLNNNNNKYLIKNKIIKKVSYRIASNIYEKGPGF